MKKILHTILEVHFFYVILIAFVVAMSSLYICNRIYAEIGRQGRTAFR